MAVYRDGRPEIIQNDQGARLMASCVGFNETERFIGEEAKLHVDSNSENTIYGGFFLSELFHWLDEFSCQSSVVIFLNYRY